jgi:colicin import membrane protein
MAHDDDSLLPWIYSLACHLGLALVVFVGIWWTSKTVEVSIPGQIIDVSLIGQGAPPPPPKRQKKPEPKKEAEKPKVEEPAPEAPKHDRKEQEKVTDKITAQKAEEDARVQDELRRKEQVELAEKQAAEAEKKKKLEEEKAQQKRDRAAKEAAEKQKKAEQDYMQSMLADEARTGQEGTDTSLEAEYYAAIQKAVTDAWLRPESTPPGLRCTLEIVQYVGGDVVSASVVNPCNADAATRTSLEQAPQRASPLPYSGYEKVYKRRIRFEFTYDG